MRVAEIDRLLNHMAASASAIGTQIRNGEEPNPVQVRALERLQDELAVGLDQISIDVMLRRLNDSENQIYLDAVQTFLGIVITHRLQLLMRQGERRPFQRLLEEVREEL